MSPPPSFPGPLQYGLPTSAVLPYLAAALASLITGVFAFFAARSTSTAPQQMAMNDAFRALMDDLQAERATLTARISVLESDVIFREAEIVRMRGEVRGTLQSMHSLIRWCERSGVEVPKHFLGK